MCWQELRPLSVPNDFNVSEYISYILINNENTGSGN